MQLSLVVKVFLATNLVWHNFSKIIEVVIGLDRDPLNLIAGPTHRH
jgi:hypothetical protein